MLPHVFSASQLHLSEVVLVGVVSDVLESVVVFVLLVLLVEEESVVFVDVVELSVLELFLSDPSVWLPFLLLSDDELVDEFLVELVSDLLSVVELVSVVLLVSLSLSLLGSSRSNDGLGGGL